MKYLAGTERAGQSRCMFQSTTFSPLLAEYKVASKLSITVRSVRILTWNRALPVGGCAYGRVNRRTLPLSVFTPWAEPKEGMFTTSALLGGFGVI